VGYRSLNNLNNIDYAYKDKTDFNIKNNVVYKSHCKNCDASYIEPKGNYKRELRSISIILIIKEWTLRDIR